MDFQRIKEAAKAAAAVLRGVKLEPVRAVLPPREVVAYDHIDKASAYGRALEGLGVAISKAHISGTPQRALEIIAEAVEAADVSTLVAGRPVMLVAALREASTSMAGKRWGEYIDQYETKKAAEAEEVKQ